MSGTGSRSLPSWADAVWAAFAVLNFVAMVEWHAWETVPFHLVWISLIVLYGFRLWPPAKTAVILAAVCAASTAVLLHEVVDHGGSPAELLEVPLMAATFLAMVWHARRRQAALAAVEQAARREREFVRDASHLLRTPITVARGHAELLAGSLDGVDGDDAEIVVDELTRLSRIADRLLLLASAEHPGFAGLAPVDVGRLLRRTARRWEVAHDRDWRCEVLVEGAVAADEERLVCALDAVIENAVKATGPGGRIALRAREEDGALVLEVADDGPGIPPELGSRVFDRFTRTGGGTGLGLSIVRAIAVAHGGDAAVVSAPGEGTTVRLRLPGLQARAVERSATAA